MSSPFVGLSPIQRGALEEAKKSKPFRPIDFLLRRAVLILVIGTLSFIVLAILVTPFASPSYLVDALLMINPAKEPTLTGRERDIVPGDVGLFKNTLVSRVSDPDVLRAALRNLPVERRPEFLRKVGESDRGVFRLMSRVKAEEVPRTYLIRLSMSSNQPGGLAETLNAVAEAFIAKLREEQESQYRARLTYLRNERKDVADRIEKERDRLIGLADSVKNRSFLQESYTAHLTKVDIIQKLYWEASSDAATKKGLLAQAEQNRKLLTELSLEPFAQERMWDNFGINQIDRWTYEQAQDLRATIDGLTADNPDRKYVEGRITAMNDYRTSYKAQVSELTIKNLESKRLYDLDTEIIKARTAFESAQATADDLAAQLKVAMEEASRVSEAMFSAADVSYTIEQLRTRLVSIDTRIDDSELEAKAPIPVSIDKFAVPPVRAVKTNLNLLRMAALLLSFGFIGGACLIFDFIDSRLRCREDLGAALGGRGAEPVPALRRDGHESPEFYRIYDVVPTHPAVFAIRDLAARLVLESQRSGAKRICFLAANPRVGTTTLTLHTARALAAYGLRVLVVEIPTERPGLAEASRLSAHANHEAGKVSVSADWSAIESGPVPRVDILPWHRGDDEDVVRASVEGFLTAAGMSYDMIFLDAPSIRTSDIAHETSTGSDVVVIVARNDQTEFVQVRSAIEWVAVGGVPAVTAILMFSLDYPVLTRVSYILRSARVMVSELHGKFAWFGRHIYYGVWGSPRIQAMVRRFSRKEPGGPES